MKEEWKDIFDFNNVYQVSNIGNIRNKKYDRRLKPQINKSNGYFEVKLCQNQKSKHFTVHRLVAKYFVENKNNKSFVNHKDCDKLNNNFRNLEWVTKSENGIHAGKAGLISVNLRKEVNQFTLDDKFIKKHKSVKDAAISVGGFKTNISACCCGKAKTSMGYKWRFSDENNRNKV